MTSSKHVLLCVENEHASDRSKFDFYGIFLFYKIIVIELFNTYFLTWKTQKLDF